MQECVLSVAADAENSVKSLTFIQKFNTDLMGWQESFPLAIVVFWGAYNKAFSTLRYAIWDRVTLKYILILGVADFKDDFERETCGFTFKIIPPLSNA